MGGLFDDVMYNGQSIHESTETYEGTMSDRISYILGKAVIRQIRVKKGQFLFLVPVWFTVC